MAEFMLELDNANLRETQLKTTNKKLTAISHRAQVQAEELQRVNLAAERQIAYLQARMQKLLDMIEPDKAAIFRKETRRAMHKIQNQADIDHE